MSEIRYKPDRRAELLLSAREILAEKGLEATTVSEIVARAGVAQGTFYLYFPSKMAILTALNQELNEHIISAVREATAQANNAAEVVQAGVAAAFRELERYRDVLHVIHSRMSAHPTLNDWEEQFGPYRTLVTELIRQRQTTGEIAESVNPDIWARLIIGLINHAADECFIYHVQAEPHVYISELIHFISSALGVSVSQ